MKRPRLNIENVASEALRSVQEFALPLLAQKPAKKSFEPVNEVNYYPLFRISVVRGVSAEIALNTSGEAEKQYNGYAWRDLADLIAKGLASGGHKYRRVNEVITVVS